MRVGGAGPCGTCRASQKVSPGGRAAHRGWSCLEWEPWAHPALLVAASPCPGRYSGLQWRRSLDLNSQRLDWMAPREER